MGSFLLVKMDTNLLDLRAFRVQSLVNLGRFAHCDKKFGYCSCGTTFNFKVTRAVELIFQIEI